jgi:hypothetical protein
MESLHGKNIWNEDRLKPHFDALGIVGTSKPNGSPLGGIVDELDNDVKDLLFKWKPRIFLEVGVFRGSTTTKVARLFKENEGFEDSYVISMDTWILDIQYQRRGIKSLHDDSIEYFSGDRISGGSMMYYQFLANCVEGEVSDRIIPLPTASSNGAYTLLSHGVRPDFMYIDASHANPDVFIDYENFYNILKPGGVMTIDDLQIPAVKVAFQSLTERYGLVPVTFPNQKNQAYVVKPDE